MQTISPASPRLYRPGFKSSRPFRTPVTSAVAEATAGASGFTHLTTLRAGCITAARHGRRGVGPSRALCRDLSLTCTCIPALFAWRCAALQTVLRPIPPQLPACRMASTEARSPDGHAHVWAVCAARRHTLVGSTLTMDERRRSLVHALGCP